MTIVWSLGTCLRLEHFFSQKDTVKSYLSLSPPPDNPPPPLPPCPALLACAVRPTLLLCCSVLCQLVALTASPAGELTLYNTVVRIEQLLDRLGADLAAPVQHLQEVGLLLSSSLVLLLLLVVVVLVVGALLVEVLLLLLLLLCSSVRCTHTPLASLVAFLGPY